MKKIILSGILFFHCYQIFPQADHWTSKSSLINHGRMAGAAFSIGSKGFVGMGTDFNAAQQQLKDFWEYDPAADAYTQIADYPGGGVNGAGTFTLGDKGYVCCGAGNGNFYNDLWAYDTISNSWTQKTSLPGSVRDYTVGFSINGRGYIATGWSGSQDLSDVWEYDPVQDSWTMKASLSGMPRSSASGFSIAGKGYIATGYVAGGTVDCWEFDPAANSWTQKADVGTIPRSDGVGFSIGDYGYICCGYGTNYPDNDLWEYDPAANTWTQRTMLNGTGRANPVSFTIGLKAYVFGGSDATIKALDDMQEYTADSTLVNTISSEDFSVKNWIMYPNPVREQLTVDDRQSTIKSIEIYDLSGEIKYSNTAVNSKLLTVDRRPFPKGVYVVNVNGIKKKLVIQ